MRLSSVAATFTFISRKNALNLPAHTSKHTLNGRGSLPQPSGAGTCGSVAPQRVQRCLATGAHCLDNREGGLEPFQEQHPKQGRSDDIFQ